MAGLLKSDGGTSSMRFSLILVVIGAFILMLAAAIYIVASALNPQIPEPQWAAIGAYAIGIAGIVTGLGWTKVQQKKVEVNGAK